MTRISTFIVLSGTLAVLAFSANEASAENIKITSTPTVHVNTPLPAPQAPWRFRVRPNRTPAATSQHIQSTVGLATSPQDNNGASQGPWRFRVRHNPNLRIIRIGP
jgi:hypothetical protein